MLLFSTTTTSEDYFNKSSFVCFFELCYFTKLPIIFVRNFKNKTFHLGLYQRKLTKILENLTGYNLRGIHITLKHA